MSYHFEKTFKKDDLHELTNHEFEECTFLSCDFSGNNLNGSSFTDCTFLHCDLSNSKIINTSFKECTFSSCKILGLHFDDCNRFLFALHFKDCVLNFSSFYQMDLKDSSFVHCQLQEVDFAGADLSNLHLDSCNLPGATFEKTDLTSANLSSSKDFTIDPENNTIKRATFSQANIYGLLDKYDIIID